MKTIGKQSQIDSIINRDTIATANLRALEANRGLTVTTPQGERILINGSVDPVIYANVHDSIVRLALRRFYKPGRA